MATESFFSNASLAYLASAGAGKDGKTYSIKPTDGTGDFTFSRGSNLAATRVGPDGLIEKGRENLFLQSNNFTTTWSAANLTVTSGETGYDGGNAWKFLPSGAPLTHFLYQNVTGGGIVTFSVYAKAAGYPGLFVYSDQSFAGKYFNVENGTLGDDYGSPIDSSITAVGNGWYRCTVTVSHTSGNFNIFVSPDGVNTYGMAADGTSAVLVQDAQMEAGLAATDYIESGASTGKAGLLEDEPRFDYSGGATCPSLLLEPSRTNLFGYSEYFGSGWSLSNISATYNHSISPEGLQNATLMEPTTNDAYLREMSNSFTSGNSYTASVYMKSNSGSSFDIDLRLRESGGGQDVTETKTITTEWQRFDISLTATITGTYQFWIGTSGTWSLNEDLLIWGAQMEQGSYPTSYIPNHSGGSVTRGADDATSDTSSFGITDEFTLFIDADAVKVDGTSLNQMGEFRWYTQATNRYRFYKSTDAIFISNNIQVDDRTKIALKITASECKTFVDGVLDSTISLTTPFASFDSILRNMETKVKENLNQILLFPEALSDADCIQLTTL